MSRLRNEHPDQTVYYSRGWTAFDCLEALLRLRVARAAKDPRDTFYYIFEFSEAEMQDAYDSKPVAKSPHLTIVGSDLDVILTADSELKMSLVKSWVVRIEETICAPALPPIPADAVKSVRPLEQVAALMAKLSRKAIRELKYAKTFAPEVKTTCNLGLAGQLETIKFLFNEGTVRPIASVLAQYTFLSAIAEREVLLYMGRYPDNPAMYHHQVEDISKSLDVMGWYLDGFNAQRFQCFGTSRYGRK